MTRTCLSEQTANQKCAWILLFADELGSSEGFWKSKKMQVMIAHFTFYSKLYSEDKKSLKNFLKFKFYF